MQGTKIRLFAGSLLMIAAIGHVRADTLQPDPAWLQGTLSNGFQWQVLPTPQRPSDRIEVRLVVNAGSLTESTQQVGYSRFLPQLALAQNAALKSFQPSSLWQQGADPQQPLPPVIVSYDTTLFALSLPNNRNDLLKEALAFLAGSAGKLTITEQSVAHALRGDYPVATWPADPQDGWWHYRLKGSSLLGHDPAASIKVPVDIGQLRTFYHKWYTPDAMTLIVAGNVDNRSVIEQIHKTFGSLKGKRDMPVPVATIAPLKREPVSVFTSSVSQDRLSVMWDDPWLPIRDSAALLRYWRADLAREALFLHVQQELNSKDVKDIGLGFDCRVLFLRAQCSINLESSGDKLKGNLALLTKELAALRDNGLSQEEFDALVARKGLELEKLFATYARTDTNVLISQRLRSLQNQVVDIAPEQYQKLRKAFLSDLTLDAINQELHQLLTQNMALVLLQPLNEPEYNMQELQADWDKVMAPPAAAPAVDSNAQPQPEAAASDTPQAQQ